MKIEDIKIKIYLRQNPKDALASVKLSFPVEIDGVETFLDGNFYRIMPKHYGTRTGRSYRVIPPKIQIKGIYKAAIIIRDEETWYKLEEMILNECEKTLKEATDTAS